MSTTTSDMPRCGLCGARGNREAKTSAEVWMATAFASVRCPKCGAGPDGIAPLKEQPS